jgi:hypothetical protein
VQGRAADAETVTAPEARVDAVAGVQVPDPAQRVPGRDDAERRQPDHR